jgi:3-oxoacyl-[acyl-carrier-protein] synthase III
MIVAAENENNAGLFPDKLVGIRETASAIILDSDPSNDKGFSGFQFSYHLESLPAYTTNFMTGEPQPHLHIEKDVNLEARYIACIIPAVQELMKREGLDGNRIDKVFPPQISGKFITGLSEALNFPVEKFVDIVGEGADYFTSSLAYTLEHVFDFSGFRHTGCLRHLSLLNS